MDGQKLEGQLSHSYCAQASQQSDHHGERYAGNRPTQWLQWFVAGLCIHSLVLAVLWGAVWHNASEQDPMLTIELVSSDTQNGGEPQQALVNPSSTAQLSALPKRNEPRVLDPYSSTDPAAVSDTTPAEVSADNPEIEFKPELALDRTPVKDTSRPVAPKPVIQKPAPAAARPSQAPAAKLAAATASTALPASQSDAQLTPGGAASASAASAVSDTDRSPSILSSPKPPYPRDAFRAKQEGRVSVDIEVLSDGKVGRTLLQTTSGVSSLDESALESIKKWQYAPGSKSGKLNAQWIRVVVSFELKNR